jgi:hypothetical protein
MLSPLHVGQARRFEIESMRSSCVDGPDERVAPKASKTTAMAAMSDHDKRLFRRFTTRLH